MDNYNDLPDYNRMDIMLPWKDRECVINPPGFQRENKKKAAIVVNVIIRKLIKNKL